MEILINSVLIICAVWFFLSGIALYIEEYLFFQLLKKSGVRVSLMKLFSFGYTSSKHKSWKKENQDLNIASSDRMKTRRVIKINSLISVFLLIMVLVIKISTNTELSSEVQSKWNSYKTIEDK